MHYQFANRINQLQGSPLRENAKRNMEAKDVISFAYGYPSIDAFPMETLKTISERMYTEFDPESFLQYGASEGLPELRELVKQRIAKQSAIASDDDLMIVSGSTQAMDLVIKVLCNEGDVVLCEEQTFSGAVNAIKGYGAKAVPVPMNVDEECIDTKVLEELLAKDTEHRIKLLYLIPTFQNPLGTSIPLEKRQEIYAIAKKYGLLIFEDDPYGDLLYFGDAIPKMKSFDTDDLIIYAGSFSKILAPSTRLGFVMAPPAIFEKLVLAKQVSDSHTNFYWQVLLTEFMKNYDFEQHVSYLKELYRKKLTVMLEELAKLPQDAIHYIEPTGGYFICCELAEDVDEEAFLDYLFDHKVIVIPGNIMSVSGKGYEKFFRLNFTKPTIEDIRLGIQQMQDAISFARVEQVSKAI